MEATKHKIKQAAAGDQFKIARDGMISLNYINLEHNLQDFGGYQYFNGLRPIKYWYPPKHTRFWQMVSWRKEM